MTPHGPLRERFCRYSIAPLCLVACQAAPPQLPTPHSDIVRGELTQIVNAQPSNCGAVLRYVRDDRLDYRVECESGQVYRIRVGADGRVQVKAHDAALNATPAAAGPAASASR